MSIPDSINWPTTKEGGLRRLRSGEISLSRSLFRHSISYHRVWIHLESYLPFNMQNPDQAMAPNGEIWFRPGKYRHDFSKGSLYYKHLFLHEMMHVWQHQRGMWVRTRGLLSWATNYHYTLDRCCLGAYGLEQQASIVSDYWVLVNYGFYHSPIKLSYEDYDPSVPEQVLIEKYRRVLRHFPL